ncbi:hypothetical protein J6590_006330 [Homalodisca vitripennis]|nr:hypothetical protein J6590_006330 [Homalodisca vitripennis]
MFEEKQLLGRNLDSPIRRNKTLPGPYCDGSHKHRTYWRVTRNNPAVFVTTGVIIQLPEHETILAHSGSATIGMSDDNQSSSP